MEASIDPREPNDTKDDDDDDDVFEGIKSYMDAENEFYKQFELLSTLDGSDETEEEEEVNDQTIRFNPQIFLADELANIPSATMRSHIAKNLARWILYQAKLSPEQADPTVCQHLNFFVFDSP
jgi:hypothetical protein